MNPLTSIATSGLQAAQLQLQASAHNVANAATPNFRRDVVRAQPQEGGGVQARTEMLPQPGSNLAADLIDQQSAAYAFKANLQVIQTADQSMGRLLDTRA